MVITIPAFETLEEVNRYTNFSFKPSLGCSSYSSVHALAAALFPLCSLAALTQRTTSGQSTDCSISTALRIHHKYLK
jgi:hypothetical protein